MKVVQTLLLGWDHTRLPMMYCLLAVSKWAFVWVHTVQTGARLSRGGVIVPEGRWGERETEDNFPVDIAILRAPLKHLLSLLERERERKRKRTNLPSYVRRCLPSCYLGLPPATGASLGSQTWLAGRSSRMHHREEAARRAAVSRGPSPFVLFPKQPQYHFSFTLHTGIPRRDRQTHLETNTLRIRRNGCFWCWTPKSEEKALCGVLNL